MLIGYYEHSLDSKNRLVVPSKFRQDLGQNVYILRGHNGCLSVYHEEAFKKLIEKLETLHFTEEAPRQFIRASLYSACDLEIDKAGRIQIPVNLINRHHIGKEVVVTGAGDHIEVWDKEAFKAYDELADANYDANAENLFKHSDKE